MVGGNNTMGRDEILARVYISNSEIMTYLSEEEQSKCVGPVLGHLVINRERKEVNSRLYNDFFL